MSHHPQPVMLEEIVEATKPEIRAQLPSDQVFRWIERDSRQTQPGDLFIAVPGERFDGHDFVGDAIERGAIAALVRRDRVASLATGLPLLIVEDPVVALQQIAAQRRRRHNPTVIGITGSLGKSSTKEVVAAVLAEQFSVYRSPGNMNSELGLPLSLLEAPLDAEIAVLEMGGAYAPGEVALLAEIAKPSIGIVTNVHPIHLERMGSIEAIAATKCELPASLSADGTAILNGDDPVVRAMAEVTQARTVFVGRREGNDFRAVDVESLGLTGTTFTLVAEGERITVTTTLTGDHPAELALPAIAVGRLFEMPMSSILTALKRPAIQIRLLPKSGPNGSMLLDDTYNAAAPSVLSALSLLRQIDGERRIAVLGDMRELGSFSAEQHQVVGDMAGSFVDRLVTFGASARMIAKAAVERASVDGHRLDVTSFERDQRDELTVHLLAELRSGDVVLLKGSRGLEMETIVAALVAAAPVAGQSA